MTKPTCGTKVITRNGFHKRIPVRSYLVALTEIGGSRVKAVRLDEQTGWEQARETAEKDYPGWRFKGTFPLMDRDFSDEEVSV